MVVERKISNIKRIESAYTRVRLSVHSADDDESPIIVRGPAFENVSPAKKDILEKLGMMILVLNESFVARIVGRGGETILRLRKEYDVVIYFEQKNHDAKGRRELYSFGEKGRTKAAKVDLISIINVCWCC